MNAQRTHQQRRRLALLVLVSLATLATFTTMLTMPRAAADMPTAPLPSCVLEDGSGGPLPCRWDASVVDGASNGRGASFDVYPVGKPRHGMQRVRYVHDDGRVTTGTI